VPATNVAQALPAEPEELDELLELEEELLELDELEEELLEDELEELSSQL
jgi:hypothetical protein